MLISIAEMLLNEFCAKGLVNTFKALQKFPSSNDNNDACLGKCHY